MRIAYIAPRAVDLEPFTRLDTLTAIVSSVPHSSKRSICVTGSTNPLCWPALAAGVADSFLFWMDTDPPDNSYVLDLCRAALKLGDDFSCVGGDGYRDGSKINIPHRKLIAVDFLSRSALAPMSLAGRLVSYVNRGLSGELDEYSALISYAASIHFKRPSYAIYSPESSYAPNVESVARTHAAAKSLGWKRRYEIKPTQLFE